MRSSWTSPSSSHTVTGNIGTLLWDQLHLVLKPASTGSTLALTWHCPAYSLCCGPDPSAVSLMNPVAGSWNSGPALWGGRGWTSEPRAANHSWCLKNCTSTTWVKKKWLEWFIMCGLQGVSWLWICQFQKLQLQKQWKERASKLAVQFRNWSWDIRIFNTVLLKLVSYISNTNTGLKIEFPTPVK